jgi:hypothetical protein
MFELNEVFNIPLHIVLLLDYKPGVDTGHGSLAPAPIPQLPAHHNSASSSKDNDSNSTNNKAHNNIKEQERRQSVIENFLKSLFEVSVPFSSLQIAKLVRIHVTTWEELPHTWYIIQQSALATRFDLIYSQLYYHWLHGQK